MAVVTVLVITVLALRGISKPFFGLLGLVVVYIVQPGELYPSLAPLHMERTLAIFVLASFFLHGNKLRFPRVTRWFLAFYGSMVLAIPLAFWPGNSLAACVAFGEIVVFHLLTVSLLITEDRIKKFIVLTVVLMGWQAGSSMLLYMEGVRSFAMGIERAGGLTSSGGDANSLGITLVTAMPLEFLLMTKGNTMWTRLLGLGVFLVSLCTIVSTGSRTAFFAFTLCVSLLVLADWRKRLKFLPLLFVAAPLLWLVIPQQYKARYETVENLQNDDSYQNRVLSWEGGIHMFLHNPLTGVGPDNYTDANGEKYWPGKPRHFLNAHSLFFKLIGELGIVGLITFGGYLLGLFRLNQRMLRQWKDRTDRTVVQRFPLYCQVSLGLLLFTGYSAHNLYRSTWFVLGAISCSIGMLKQFDTTAAAVTSPVNAERQVGAWVPRVTGESVLQITPR
jgi:O-antigen ligase